MGLKHHGNPISRRARQPGARLAPPTGAPDVWLLCERGLGPTGRRKHYLVSLPPAASLRQLVRLAHQRGAIEQH
jgi:hypothetical protein